MHHIHTGKAAFKLKCYSHLYRCGSEPCESLLVSATKPVKTRINILLLLPEICMSVVMWIVAQQVLKGQLQC